MKANWKQGYNLNKHTFDTIIDCKGKTIEEMKKSVASMMKVFKAVPSKNDDLVWVASMMDKCKECPDGEMVLKIGDEELQYRGKPLVVPIPYHECNSCGFDIVSYDLSVLNDALVQHAKTKVYNDE